MKKTFYALSILFVIFTSACHKDKINGGQQNVSGPNAPGSVADKIKDSIYLYAQEDYLWNTALPTYVQFQPRSFSTKTVEVDKISQIAINPATGQAYEYLDSEGDAKYSFIDSGAVAAELNGVKGDFGFGLLYNEINDIRVSYVYPGSPADQQGMKRGDQITSIDGRTDLSYDATGYGDGSSNNLNFVVNAYQNSSTITMVLQRTDGTTYTVTNMNVSNYTVNPVLVYKTFNEGNGHIVGYIVFNSFTSDDNADPQLNAAFDYFTQQGVTDLVVDLRYNGGGYVSTAEYLDNLIVPAAKSGTLMYNTYYNSNLQNDKDPLLTALYNVPKGSFTVQNNVANFGKIGSLNVGQVFFIITDRTASASELTINNLRPELNVQYIGETSYGKPVGFFAIDINVYQLYIPEFYTENSASQGGYYSGFTPGTAAYPGIADYDDLTKDFGDPTEGLLAHALNYVQTGTYSVKTPVIQSLPSQQHTLSLETRRSISQTLMNNKFTGMIIDKKTLSAKRLKPKR